MINIEKVTVDKLSLYRGRPVKINDSISMCIPTIGDISDYGEEKYYSMIYNLCSVGIDLCWQLEEVGIKFDEISDYELFVNILCKNYNTDQTKIIFGDKLNFQKMKTCFNTENKSIVLCQTYLISIPLKKSPSLKSDTIVQIPVDSSVVLHNKYSNEFYEIQYGQFTGYIISDYLYKKDNNYFIYEPEVFDYRYGSVEYGTILIDEYDYYKIVSYLRAMHNLKRDDRIAGTNSCRMAFIEDAKMEYEEKKNEPFKSNLLPMISTLVNMDGFKRNDSDIWDMNIYAFMDSVKRISKIRNSTLLLQSGYSGFGIDLNKIKNKNELDFMGELN